MDVNKSDYNFQSSSMMMFNSN